MKTIKVGILGGSGYAGSELYALLKDHAVFDVQFVSSEALAGQIVESVDKRFFNTSKKSLLKFQHIRELPYDLDCVFSALPTGILPKYVNEVLNKTGLIFNISGDFRFKDKRVLEKYYPETLKNNDSQVISSYYIPEFSTFDNSSNIINLPGCMALASIYAVYPLVKDHLIKNSLFIDAKTGSSGAGKSVRETAADRFGNFRLYRAFNHRHLPEIKASLSPDVKNVGFAAYSLDISRGIYASAYTQLKAQVTELDVKKAFFKTYKQSRFIKTLTRKGQVPMLKLVNGTNYAQVKAIVHGNQCISVVAIDNLIKGAAGQAIQAANNYYDVDEGLGLGQTVGMWP